jgi:hypothetical protein
MKTQLQYSEKGILNNSEYMFASIVEPPLRALMKESFMKEYTILYDSKTKPLKWLMERLQ